MLGAEEDISEALRPVVSAAGLEIWDVERTGTSLRVMVERASGLDLEAISEVSVAISEELDRRDDLVPAGRYSLEVSSPGLERRLRYPRHFARYIGHEVAVKRAAGSDGPRRLQGVLLAATDADITLQTVVPEAGSEEIHVPLDLVERANVVFSWGQAPKPARPKHPARKGVLDRSTQPVASATEEAG